MALSSSICGVGGFAGAAPPLPPTAPPVPPLPPTSGVAGKPFEVSSSEMRCFTLSLSGAVGSTLR
jgi:hypothetical protein